LRALVEKLGRRHGGHAREEAIEVEHLERVGTSLRIVARVARVHVAAPHPLRQIGAIAAPPAADLCRAIAGHGIAIDRRSRRRIAGAVRDGARPIDVAGRGVGRIGRRVARRRRTAVHGHRFGLDARSEREEKQ